MASQLPRGSRPGGRVGGAHRPRVLVRDALRYKRSASGRRRGVTTMIHSIRWLGPLVLSTAALTAGNAAAQSSPAAPRRGIARAGRLGSRPRATHRPRTPRPQTRRPTTSIARRRIASRRRTSGRPWSSTTRRSCSTCAAATRPPIAPRCRMTCPNLAREDRFSYKTTMNQLCSIDLITVLEQYGARLARRLHVPPRAVLSDPVRRGRAPAQRARHAALDTRRDEDEARGAAAEERSAARRIERAGNA